MWLQGRFRAELVLPINITSLGRNIDGNAGCPESFIENKVNIIGGISGTAQTFRARGVPRLGIQNNNTGQKQAHGGNDRKKRVTHYHVLGKEMYFWRRIWNRAKMRIKKGWSREAEIAISPLTFRHFP